jgi:hypothetical protein
VHTLPTPALHACTGGSQGIKVYLSVVGITHLPYCLHRQCFCGCRNGTALPSDMLRALKACNDDTVSEHSQRHDMGAAAQQQW